MTDSRIYLECLKLQRGTQRESGKASKRFHDGNSNNSYGRPIQKH